MRLRPRPKGGLPRLQALQAERGLARRTLAGARHAGLPADRGVRGDAAARRSRGESGPQPVAFPSAVQVDHRRDAEGLCHRAPRGRVRDELAQGGSVTEAIYGAGFNSSGRFYETSNATLGMTPKAFRDGGAEARIRFAVGECSLGSILVAKSEKGVCAISVRRRSRRAGARVAGPLSQGRIDRRRQGVREGGGEGRRLRRSAGQGPRPAARHPRHRVPAAGVAGAAQDPGRQDR